MRRKSNTASRQPLPRLSSLLKGDVGHSGENILSLSVSHRCIEKDAALVRWAGVCTTPQQVLMHDDTTAAFISIPLIGNPQLDMIEGGSRETHVLREGSVSISRNRERVTGLSHDAGFECISVAITQPLLTKFFESGFIEAELRMPDSDRFFLESPATSDLSRLAHGMSKKLSSSNDVDGVAPVTQDTRTPLG